MKDSKTLVELARRIVVRSKHGPRGQGGDGPCDDDCLKCEAERIIARKQPS